jgi:signal transduction histidine kinase
LSADLRWQRQTCVWVVCSKTHHGVPAHIVHASWRARLALAAARSDNRAMGSFELLASLTARLASTARLDEIVDTVLGEIVELGFGAVWMATLDDQTGNLVTLKEVIDGVDTTHEMPRIFMLDMRQPIGHGFRERRMINVADPDALHIIERDGDPVPADVLALPRVIYEHMRGHPFACGPLLGSRGQPVGALGLSSYRGRQPIPDELFAQGLLRAFMDHLGIAMERAAHVARLEQLNASLIKAQAAIVSDARIKAVGELAAAVAHDLNNLSGIALLAVSVGMRSPIDAVEALPRIERANRAIGDLVARLQRTARVPTGEAEAASLGEIIDDILVMIRPILREHQIEVEVDAPAVPPVLCDAVLVHQVVLNLLINAQDALSSVQGRRVIRLRLRDDDGVVRLLVSDNGPGLAPEVLAQLFKPFVTTKGSAHLGLGLAAAHASLKHFGGQIEGRNGRTGGAVFEVALSAAPPGTPTVTRARTRPKVVDRNRQVRILAVDDDPDIVYIIRAFLEPLGYEVTTATGARQAIEAVTAQPFDLVLCDIGMPDQSGLDVAHTLRETGYKGKLVLMTGWDSHTLSHDRRATECDTLLKKPFLGPQLVHVIDSLLAS